MAGHVGSAVADGLDPDSAATSLMRLASSLSDPADPSLVFRVAPSTAFGFGKGTLYSQTRWGFPKSP